MPNVKPPSFRQHATGVWFCHWGGRAHYFSLDRAESYKRYLDSLAEWSQWRKARDELRYLSLATPTLTVKDLASQFLDSRESEGGWERRDFYRKHLKRFLAAYSTAQAQAYKPILLQRIKDNMLAAGYKPRTINHDLQAVKTMFQWAVDLDLLQPVNTRGVRKLPLGEIPDKSWSRPKVLDFVLGTPDENMRAWLAMSYLCALRPSEAVRIMTGQGRWVQRGILQIPNKMRAKVRVPRHILFSAEAFAWWRRAKKRWTRLDSFSAAVGKARGDGSHRLRHSAATHLMLAGVSRADVDVILGHYPGRVTLTYIAPQWRRLRRLTARLTLKG